MSPIIILVVRSLHILGAMALVGGIFSREIVRAEARRTLDVRGFAALTDAAGRLDKLLVIPGGTAVALLGLILALITGAPLLGLIQGADRNWLLVATLLLLPGFVLVPRVFLPQRRRIEAALKVALEQGHITGELRAAAEEPTARLWHIVEQVIVIAVVVLMSLRPF